MIINKDGLIKLLKALDGERASDGKTFAIYDMVDDFINRDMHRYGECDDDEIERVADEIMDYCGTLEDDDMAEEMTLADIECALGRKVRII